MNAAVWLAAREVSARGHRAAIAVAVVAVAAALVSASEVLSRVREEAIARELDSVGPSILVLPADAPPGASATNDRGHELLPDGAANAARRALGRDLRGFEARLTLRRDREGPLVVGVEPERLPGVPAGGAAAGAVLAERVGAGAVVDVGGHGFRVAAVRPSNASAEDLALFVRLDELQAALGSQGVNELRIHLAPGVDAREAERRLGAAMRERIVRVDRGEVAEHGVHESLARHRLALYAFTGVVAGLALLIAAHLDAAERRSELATLVAIGAAPGTLVWAVVGRSLLVAAAGALAGALIGTGVGAVQDLGAARGVLRALPALSTIVGGAIGLGGAAAIPSALASARRDPVPDLQEGVG